MEYRISELAYYLLNPGPIKVEDMIVGCKIKYRKPSMGTIKRLIKSLGVIKGGEDSTAEEIISSYRTRNPSFKDSGLNLHFMKIDELLRPFDPVRKKLAALNKDEIEDITAICEEIGGNRYPLNLSGNINDKVKFLTNSISKQTKVILTKAYFMNGLFEMRGFKFELCRNGNEYRIIRFKLEDEIKYCVLNSDYRLQFWVEDVMLINYLIAFEQSIQIDSKLRDAVNMCARGEAKPLKLFFSKQLNQKYSENRLPMIYREILETFKIGQSQKSSIANTLNNLQSIVFFRYAPISGQTSQKFYTNISVMHDLKALEPIKAQMPNIYSEIDRKVSKSDSGRLYLMESMRETQNA